MNAITISGLTKQYGRKRALDGVSLEVAAGEIFGFLGPNGAGKTTAIRCIMDFIRPDGGSITVLGKDSHRDGPALKRGIGYLGAENQLYGNWTTSQHINLVGAIRGGTQQAYTLQRRLELPPNTQARHLSTGNKQKLGMVLALMGRPKLLILDEPTRGLDPLLQHQIYQILRDYTRGGGTVFLSSHNLDEVERICTNVGVLRNGRIVAAKSLVQLRGMKTHIVTVRFTKPVPRKSLELPHVEITSATDSVITLRVSGDLNPLLTILARYPVSDLEITHAPLEDVFMEYYESHT